MKNTHPERILKSDLNGIKHTSPPTRSPNSLQIQNQNSFAIVSDKDKTSTSRHGNQHNSSTDNESSVITSMLQKLMESNASATTALKATFEDGHSKLEENI